MSDRKYYIYCIGLFFSFMTTMGSLLCVMNFLHAMSPTEANSYSGPKIPTNWEAGVLNHGGYIQWYLISNHPFAFGTAIVAFFVGFAGNVYFSRKLSLTKRK